MRELIPQLLDSVQRERAVACCRLVETRGSTPQKAGATMLVYEDGSQGGTLGGGCVEADVKRQALETLARGQAEVVRFTLDSDYGWDDGLICGGRMQVLIDPLPPRADASYYRRLGDRLAAGAGCVEAIVFDAAKSGLTAPACYLFDDAQQLLATRHVSNPSGDDQQTVAAGLPDLSTRPRAFAREGVAYLTNLPRCRLLIVGGGHVGQAVANLATDLDFDVWVVDDREQFVSAERFPRAERCITGPIGRTLAELDITPDTYCLIVTRGHNHDEEALFHLVNRGARYVGMIGSRRKIRLIFDDLEAEGVSSQALAKVYAPLGIDIGSQTVPEIAVSIAAELVAHRNRGEVPGRPAPIAATEPA